MVQRIRLNGSGVHGSNLLRNVRVKKMRRRAMIGWVHKSPCITGAETQNYLSSSIRERSLELTSARARTKHKSRFAVPVLQKHSPMPIAQRKHKLSTQNLAFHFISLDLIPFTRFPACALSPNYTLRPLHPLQPLHLQPYFSAPERAPHCPSSSHPAPVAHHSQMP